MDIALILETNNLASLDDEREVTDTLCALFAHLRGQTLSLDDVAEVVVTHDGLCEDARACIQAAAGRTIAWVRIDPDTGYYAAKRAGFEETSAECVVFADSDCWPVPCWLAELTRPIVEGQFEVSAGRTTYPDDLVGIAATTIDFLYFDGRAAGTVRNFYANNVAFRRDTFAAYAYEPCPGVYRGHCQLLGIRLWEEDVPIHFAADAQTVHELADSARQLWRLRMYRGQDTAALAPDFLGSLEGPAYALKYRRPVAVATILAGRFVFSQRTLNRQDMPPVRRLRAIAARGVIGAISAADTIGAALALAGRDFHVLDGNAEREVRAYRSGDDSEIRVRKGVATAAECAA